MSPRHRRMPRPAFMTGPALLLAAVIVTHLPATAAPGRSRKKAEPETVDFARLAQHRPSKCGPDTGVVAGPAGWKEAPPMCVWQGRLEMRRWQASAVPGACIAPPAAWLAWQRPRLGGQPAAPGAAWHSGWKSHYLGGPGDNGTERIATVEMREPGVWTATEWTWSPSTRAATRTWQEGRWKLIGEAASKVRAGDTGPATPLRKAWETNLKGRAGEIAHDGWRWNSDGKCLRMAPLPPASAPLPLPRAREDARLEQRAAMQIQLARRYPGATFLMPFRLLDAPAAAPRSGAKYAAIWTERSNVTGQLWIPQKSGEAPIRAQVGATLPARYDTPSGLAAGSGTLRAIEREMTGIADTWSANHER
ncbi:hypothetical protein HHL21_03750 [Massilia sp. RP-1-19]|uniref:Uncharacterized protein n=1 Tax=Massilia polaris TaxID=2728846 RepID=A0A848HG75_9BURK|nr:hypothetical protein [Massilia polaris]NML60214.1 hypothetical protein [Massilia polaris]